MSSKAVATVTKMMESLPEPAQDQIVDHLRDHIADLQDEMRWDITFEKTQQQLITAARKAKREIAEGKSELMDYDRL